MKVRLLFFTLFLVTVSAQSQRAEDSLHLAIRNEPVNRNTLQRYLDRLQDISPGEADNFKAIGEWVIARSNTDSLRELQATANLVLGKIYTNTLDFEEGTRYLTTALSIAEQHDFYAVQAQALNGLGSIYSRNALYDKAIDYYKQSYDISKKNNYERGMAAAAFNMGSCELADGLENKGKERASFNAMLSSYKTMKALKDTQSIINQSWSLSDMYARLSHFDSAVIVLAAAEQLIKATGKEVGYVKYYHQAARLYYAEKRFPEAIKYYGEGLAHAKKYNVPRWLCMYYFGMADAYEGMGNYKMANYYNGLNIKMHDALVSRENFVAAADIQNSYERAKKDNEILKLAAANNKKATLNKILFGATVGLLIIGFLGYLVFKNRHKISKQQEELQLQKIKELEKDKQLISIDAMLKGQEEERSRIAKDLHDGLGGLLSGTKLSFMNVKENLVLNAENTMQFDRSLSMLDNTIRDLRKVAHNLMPEALVKFGLHEALRDFCDSIQASFSVKILYQHFGEKRKLDNTAEVFIYRIIQELVNNAVKHANANQIFVQLAMTETKTGITVEDNGKGFDKNSLLRTKGAGMANINYRVQYLNGCSDVVTSPGNGTSVNIELKA